MKVKSVLASTILLLTALSPTFSQDKKEPEKKPTQPYTPVTSIEAYTTLGKQTADSLLLGAEYANTQNKYDQAIKLCRQALDKDYNDIDTHQEYAQALENKLRIQTKRDPYLFNECIKQWLIVLRCEAGDENGIGFHGIAVPGLGHIYQDEDRTITARRHLQKLSGSTPKYWETDARFLKRVCQNSSATVKGQVIPKRVSTADDKEDSE